MLLNPRRRGRGERLGGSAARALVEGESIRHHRAIARRTDLQPGQAERAQRSLAHWQRWRRRRSNPSYFGVRVPRIPRTILGLPGPLVAIAAAIGAYAAFSERLDIGAWLRGGAEMPMLGGLIHRNASVVPTTGMVRQSSAPQAPPPGSQGNGEWVVVTCGDHGSPGVCWEWHALSTIATPGIGF
jgi:hypothetical protein